MKKKVFGIGASVFFSILLTTIVIKVIGQEPEPDVKIPIGQIVEIRVNYEFEGKTYEAIKIQFPSIENNTFTEIWVVAPKGNRYVKLGGIVAIESMGNIQNLAEHYEYCRKNHY